MHLLRISSSATALSRPGAIALFVNQCIAASSSSGISRRRIGTTSISPAATAQPLQSTSNRTISTVNPLSSTVPIRQASTAATPSDAAAAPEIPSQTLTWNEFLRLRKVRRWYDRVASVAGAGASTAGGVFLLGQQNLNTLSQQFFGLDPMFVMGAWTIAFFGLGWLLGPILGSGVFRLVNRRMMTQMQAKEKDFFERIKKWRVDPTNSSMQNPVPDYYGEKITSVQGYRRWLKDQRAYNKKRQSFI